MGGTVQTLPNEEVISIPLSFKHPLSQLSTRTWPTESKYVSPASSVQKISGLFIWKPFIIIGPTTRQIILKTSSYDNLRPEAVRARARGNFSTAATERF